MYAPILSGYSKFFQQFQNIYFFNPYNNLRRRNLTPETGVFNILHHFSNEKMSKELGEVFKKTIKFKKVAYVGRGLPEIQELFCLGFPSFLVDLIISRH